MHICPICGYSKLKYIPNNSYEICPCCGYEFGTFDFYITNTNLYFDLTDMGYYEENEEMFHFVRDLWVEHGAKWFNKNEQPKDWCLENQLRNLLKIEILNEDR